MDTRTADIPVHFLLFNLPNPALLAGSSPDFQSRVVVVSAAAYRLSGINVSDNYHYQNGGYHPWGAYAHTKVANVYMANEIERRCGSQDLNANSLHLGMYLNDCAEAEKSLQDGKPMSGQSVPHTFSPEDEMRVWKDSLEMVGSSDKRGRIQS